MTSPTASFVVFATAACTPPRATCDCHILEHEHNGMMRPYQVVR